MTTSPFRNERGAKERSDFRGVCPGWERRTQNTPATPARARPILLIQDRNPEGLGKRGRPPETPQFIWIIAPDSIMLATLALSSLTSMM